MIVPALTIKPSHATEQTPLPALLPELAPICVVIVAFGSTERVGPLLLLVNTLSEVHVLTDAVGDIRLIVVSVVLYILDGMDEEGQVRLLAKVIGAEAGPNKLDQLLVGAVVINRVYSDEFAYADSIIEVIKAPSQYASWTNGSIASKEPTEEMLSSARQILNGEFAVPANIVFQAAFTQGDTTWLVNVNGPGYYTHYYYRWFQGSPGFPGQRPVSLHPVQSAG